MPSLVKLYADSQKRFLDQIHNNKEWTKSFASMRVALHKCIQNLSLELAVKQYHSLYIVMQEYSPENDLLVAGALAELVVESGWVLCHRYRDKNNNTMLYSTLACISSAVVHYDCINSICADFLFEKKLLLESVVYYQTSLIMLMAFLEKLCLLKIEYSTDLSSVVSEVLKKTLVIDKTINFILESVISEVLLQDLFSIANEVYQSLEFSDKTTESQTINTSTEEISDISLSIDEILPINLVNIKCFFNRRPYCAQNEYSNFIDYFSIILEKFKCNAFLFGSAHYKNHPNDLDILLCDNNAKTTNALIGEIILNHGGIIVANYEKINRRVVKMFFYNMSIDFILSSETLLEHSKRLDFTIGALYFDLRRKIMFCPNSDSFQHIQTKQLHTISDAKQMIEHDPSVIFRAVRIMASENFTLSETPYIAIKEIFLIKNIFLTMNPDKLYHEMVLLFFSGHAVKALEILVDELKIFQYIFTRLNELNQPMYGLTLSMLRCVTDMSDDFFRNSSQYFYPPPPSLFYYAVHWFVFIKDGLAQHSYPRINLIQGLTPNLNDGIDSSNRIDLHALEYYHQLLPENLSFNEYYLQSRNSFWSNKVQEEQSGLLNISSRNYQSHI